MLKIEQLSVCFVELPVLTDISIHVHPGEIVALIGPNGAGKSTLFKAIMHLGGIRITGGKIDFNGNDITNARAPSVIRKGIIYSPQGGQIFPGLTIEENLKVPLRIAGIDLKRALAEIYERYPTLERQRRQLAGTLSGGERQLLGFARALACRPRLLLLDEPSIGLSPRLAHEVFRRIQSLPSEGISVLIVEQRVKEALEISDRAYILKGGKILKEINIPTAQNFNKLYQAYFM